LAEILGRPSRLLVLRKERAMPKGLLDNPEYWRARAEETRVVAESMQDEESREMMLRIASDYEHMAERAEERSKGKAKQNTNRTLRH